MKENINSESLPVTSKKNVDGKVLMLLSSYFGVLCGFHCSILSVQYGHI